MQCRRNRAGYSTSGRKSGCNSGGKQSRNSSSSSGPSNSSKSHAITLHRPPRPPLPSSSTGEPLRSHSHPASPPHPLPPPTLPLSARRSNNDVDDHHLPAPIPRPLRLPHSRPSLLSTSHLSDDPSAQAGPSRSSPRSAGRCCSICAPGGIVRSSYSSREMVSR